MTVTARILLDEHVGRVLERVLRERGFQVVQSKDGFGEGTDDRELLEWCSENGYVFLTNNAKDFEPLHEEIEHAGLFLYRTQQLPDSDPEGLARSIELVVQQYGIDGVRNESVDLEEWYEWLQER